MLQSDSEMNYRILRLQLALGHDLEALFRIIDGFDNQSDPVVQKKALQTITLVEKGKEDRQFTIAIPHDLSFANST